MCSAILGLTLRCLPPRLAKAQLKRIIPLALLVTVTTALSDQVVSAAAPGAAPPDVTGAPSLAPLNGGYKCAPEPRVHARPQRSCRRAAPLPSAT
jgi:hypothetical protein